MFLNSLLLILLLIFSFAIFFINNIYVLLLIITITLFASILLKVKLSINYAFILIILFNFILNIIFSNLYDAILVSIRLIEMFLMVNLIITKIGIYNLGLVIEKITHSHELYLIIVIALSFIPLMSKELKEIKKSLLVKNFSLSFKNILFHPSVFLITFFNGIFKKIDEIENVLISKGIEE